MAYSHIRSITPFAGTSSVDKWATILATNPPYIPIYPTGVAATDTAAITAALTLASSTKKPIEVQPNGNILRINDWFEVGSDVTYIGNGVTHEVQMGAGGYAKKNRNQKNNVGGDPDTVFLIGVGTTDQERVRFHDIVFTASDTTEAIFRAIVALAGFDDSELLITDMLVHDMKVHSCGGLFSANGIGPGGFRMENIRGRDCGITSDAGWTGNCQLSLCDVDEDGTASRNGVFRNIRATGWKFSGSALSSFGQETDVVTIAGAGALVTGKPTGITVDDIYANGVGEVVDCMGDAIQISNVTGHDVANFVLKFIHGARYCNAKGVTGYGVGGAIVTFAGTSTANSGDTIRNVVTGVNGGNFTANETCAVLFQKNIGTQGLPKKNRVYGLEALGDSNMDWLVKDNCDVDNDNDNKVYMADGSAWGTQPISIVYTDNTKVQGPQRGVCQLSLGATQTLTTLATLDFSVATYDPEGIAVTGSDKVTLKWPGVYQVKVALKFATDLDDQDTVEIRCVGGTVTQVYRETIAKSAEEDTVTAVFTVIVKEEHFNNSGDYDIYAQAAVEGASGADVATTVNQTGMWITRVA